MAFCIISSFSAELAIAETSYQAPFWLSGGDLQTIVPAVFGHTAKIQYERVRWELEDGDFIDTDWVNRDASNQPTVVLFHGLEGNSASHYAKALMAKVQEIGWRGVVIHFRGCSGEENRLPRAYFAGDSAEIEMMLTRVRMENVESKIYVVGVSLGANALLKWLGERAEQAAGLVEKAVAVSSPLDLAACATALDHGLDRWLYTPMFVSSMKSKALQKVKRFPGLLDEEKVRAAKTIHEIDREVTAKLHGYADEEIYYAENSSKPWLRQITVPTLMLNAKNDPFVPAEILPTSDEVSSSVTLETPEDGGHVGFLQAGEGLRLDWLPTHILQFFVNCSQI